MLIFIVVETKLQAVIDNSVSAGFGNFTVFLKNSLIRIWDIGLWITFGLEMRTVLFFISLFMLLLGAEHAALAATPVSPSKEKTAYHNQLKSTDTDHYWTIDESDWDNTEEISADHFKDKVQILSTIAIYHGQWLIGKRLPDCCDRSYVVPHFCGNSTPIYLAHRVLRI